MEDPQAITQLLHSWRDGNPDAGRRIVEIVYDDLRRIAGSYMKRERPDHTLEATAVVHELYLRLFAAGPVALNDRAHLLAVAAQQVRRILVNHARDLHAQKRGGGALKLSLDHLADCKDHNPPDVLDLDVALSRLEELDSRAARVVELRYFGGLTEPEAAEALGISVATLKRDWEFARTWLLQQLIGG